MDLRQVRADLATVAASVGFGAWDYAPADPIVLPAAVVSSLKSLKRLNRAVVQFQIGVAFYASLSNALDATSRLDLTLSMGVEGSFLDALDAVPTSGDGSMAWDSVRFESASPYAQVLMPGRDGGAALTTELVLEMTGR